MAYFNSSKLPKPKKEFVCFIDIMGIQNTMQHSLSNASNFIFKLHATLLEEWRKHSFNGFAIYPIMDGAYITSNKKDDILQFLSSVYLSLANVLMSEDNYGHWYFVRAAISYGEIIHGRDIPYDASYEFSSRVGHKESILIGQPIIWAYQTEGYAPPMGIYLHESCINKSYPISSDWKWFLKKPFDYHSFREKVNNFYLYIQEHWDSTEYSREKQQEHLEKFNQYFS